MMVPSQLPGVFSRILRAVEPVANPVPLLLSWRAQNFCRLPDRLPSFFQIRYALPVSSSTNTSGSMAPAGSVLADGHTMGDDEAALKGPIGLVDVAT